MRKLELVPIALVLLLSFPSPTPAGCHPCAVKSYVDAVDDPGPAVSEALEPFLAWATVRHPEALDAIYPAGRIAVDAASAQKWLALLREWRAG